MNNSTAAPSPWRGALLTCGVLASITYVATDIYAGMRYAGYSFIDQAVSELFAIGAPTARIVVPLFTLSSACVAVFAYGVWSAIPHTRPSRWLALMLFGNAANSLLLWNFFPMHMRGETPTFTDAMHLVLSINPFVLLSVVSGIFAFTGRFRVYSAAIVLVVVVPAVVSFSNIAEFAATHVTPGMGMSERVSQYGYQLWQATLAVALLRTRHRRLQHRVCDDSTAQQPSVSLRKPRGRSGVSIGA